MSQCSVRLEKHDGPIRVLVVEDDALVAMDYCETIMAHGGFVTGIAVDSDTAIYLAQTSVPDVVIMDIRLGQGDGIDAARVIRSQVDASIVFCSGSGDPDTLGRVMEFGHAPLLTKPIAYEELLQSIVQACARARPRRTQCSPECRELKPPSP